MSASGPSGPLVYKLALILFVMTPILEVIKLEFILKLKIKRKQPISALYFEFETVLKFYDHESWHTDHQ